MPLNLPNGSTYQLCLLDTNALSEIVKRPTNEGRGFIERFPPGSYAPCFTAYNLFELRRHPDVFAEFVRYFDIYPSLLAQPFQLILEAEVACQGAANVNDIMFRAFTKAGSDSSYDFAQFIDQFFAEPAMQALETDWRQRDQNVLNSWLANKANFSPSSPTPNAHDAKQFVNDASVDTLCHIHPNVVQSAIANNNVEMLQSFPSMQMMLYSQYYRIFDPNWTASDQEVTDVCISACAPYVDAIVTENFQAEIYNKVQKHIPGMSATIAKLRDIRRQP